MLFRSVLLLGGGLVAIFGSKYVGWSGTGPLGCLAIAFVSGLRWRKECGRGQKVSAKRKREKLKRMNGNREHSDDSNDDDDDDHDDADDELNDFFNFA